MRLGVVSGFRFLNVIYAADGHVSLGGIWIPLTSRNFCALTFGPKKKALLRIIHRMGVQSSVGAREYIDRLIYAMFNAKKYLVGPIVILY